MIPYLVSYVSYSVVACLKEYWYSEDVLNSFNLECVLLKDIAIYSVASPDMLVAQTKRW